MKYMKSVDKANLQKIIGYPLHYKSKPIFS